MALTNHYILPIPNGKFILVGQLLRTGAVPEAVYIDVCDSREKAENYLQALLDEAEFDDEQTSPEGRAS